MSNVCLVDQHGMIESAHILFRDAAGLTMAAGAAGEQAIYATTQPESAGVQMSSGTLPPRPASITFLSGPLAGQTFPITKPITILGRDASNDIVIKGDLKVSRHHAQLR